MISNRKKWGVCVLLFFATTLNYLDRQTLSILAPIMQKEMALDNEDLGWLFSVFYYSYTLAQFAIGGFLDRSHLRWAYGTGVLLWSAAASLTGFATGFASLITFRLLLGVTESVNWPAAMRIVARLLRPHERSLGNGIFTSGTSIGALIAPAVILGLAGAFGWRWGFMLVGSLGVIWFALWVILTRGENLNAILRGSDEERSATSSSEGYRNVLASAQFWRVFVVTILVNPCLYFNVSWLPTYFVQQRGFQPGAQLGWILTLIYLGLDLGYLFTGAAVLCLTRQGWRLSRARTVVLSVATLALVTCGAAPFVGLTSAIALLMIVNFGVGAWISMYLTMAQEVSTTHVSTAAGLLGGSGSLAGAILMWAAGRVTQQTGSFVVPMLAVSVAALIALFAGSIVLRHTQEASDDRGE
ncbi:MAG TPA: MFS transporter [Bryobacteraceae bacterium]|nr:MFS transporter [Bryobacteraceae bacterium]